MAALEQVREVEAVKLQEVASGERRGCEEEVDETSTDGGAISGIPSCAASESGDDLQASSAPESKTQSEDEEDEEDDDEEDDEDDDEEDEEETEEERTARLEALKAGPLPSVGSAGHFTGECSRCCFFPKGRCQNGYDCPFCHFDHEKRIRKKKKKSKKAKRAAKRAEAAKAAAAAAVAAVATADLSLNCWNSSSHWRWPQSFPEVAALGPQQQQQPTYESFEEDLSQVGQISEAQRPSLDGSVNADAGAFSRRKLRARGAQVLENIMGLAGPPNANCFTPHTTETVVPTSIGQGPCGTPLWYHADMAVPAVAFGPAAVPPPPHVLHPANPGGVQAFSAAAQVPPPPYLSIPRLAETPLTPASVPAPLEEEEGAAASRKSEAKKKEFPSEALFGAPEKVKVEIKENIPPIPFRPVPVKVTIPVSELVTPIPPRPVPVKLRVSEPGPSPSPLCLEEVLARLGELQCATGCAMKEQEVGEGSEAASELVPAH